MAFVKWIGAFLGSSVGGIFGAIAGYALGSFVDGLIEGDKPRLTGGNTGSSRQSYSQSSNTGRTSGTGSSSSRGTYSGASQQTRRDSFLLSLLLLSAHVIVADNRIMHSELEYVRGNIRRNYGEAAVTQANDILDRLFQRRKTMSAAQWQQEILDCCRQLCQILRIAERRQLLAFLCEISKADGTVADVEVEVLHQLAVNLRLTTDEVDQLLNLSTDTLESAYAVLGVTPDATDDEVRRAYRRMALKYHPDKVATLGDDVRAAAEKKFKEIGAAKDKIWAARGL